MVAGTQFLNVTQAQTYTEENIPTPAGVTGFIEIHSPKNNTVTAKNQILLSITAWVGPSTINYVRMAFYAGYRGDWETNYTSLFNSFSSYTLTGSKEVTLTNVPEGNHTVVCSVGIWGKILTSAFPPNILDKIQYFSFSNSTSVSFFVDTKAPKITDVTLDNKTYSSSNVTSSFMLSEPVTKLWYSLDNQGNATISQNELNFTDLTNGVHNVTIFASDNAGNMGQSETAYFYVKLPEPFPIVSVAVASIVSIAIIVVAGLLVYHKKHKNNLIKKL